MKEQGYTPAKKLLPNTRTVMIGLQPGNDMPKWEGDADVPQS
jgi:hypothetical protein